MGAKRNHRDLNDNEFIEAYNRNGPSKLSTILDTVPSTIRHRARLLRLKGAKISAPQISSKPLKMTGQDPAQVKQNVEKLGVTAAAKLYDITAPGLSNWLKYRGIAYTPPLASTSGGGHMGPTATARSHPQRVELDVQNGVVLVFSDAHYWPGNPGVSHRALVKMAHEMEPAAIVCNGDAVDMAAVSRHPPIGWEKQPTVQEEIETAQERLGEIISACTKRTRRSWCLGNHDARFETRLASVAPEYAKIAGIHLSDHFPEWERAWSTWINDNVVIKHRFKGGVHATHNNTVSSGKTIVTGHLHSAKVTPFTDYNGTRYGVDTGCLADPAHAAFTAYTEDNPKNWISAFGVLTFRHGKLLWPELVVAFDEQSVQFRGKIIEV